MIFNITANWFKVKAWCKGINSYGLDNILPKKIEV